jgi:hypothetical protein
MWRGVLVSWGMWTATMTMFLGAFLISLSCIGYYGQRQRQSGLIVVYCTCLGFIALTSCVFGVACFVIKERAQQVLQCVCVCVCVWCGFCTPVILTTTIFPLCPRSALARLSSSLGIPCRLCCRSPPPWMRSCTMPRRI